MVLTSCQKSQETGIHIDEEIAIDLTEFRKEDSININKIFTEARYLQLIVPDDIELHTADKIYKSNDYIICIDIELNNTITVFDSSGQFQYQLESGEGPESLFEFSDVAFDEKTNTLFVLANNVNAVQRIDLRSRNRSTISFANDFYVHMIEFQSPQYLWLYRSYSKFTFEEYALSQYNLETREVVHQYYKKPEELKISFLSDRPLSRFQNSIYYGPSYSNHVMVFNRDATKKISFVNIKNTSNFFGLSDFTDFRNIMKEDNLYAYQDAFIETNSHYLFYLSRGSQLFTAAFNKNSGAGSYTSVLYDDYLELPFLPYVSTSSDALLYLFDSEIIDYFGNSGAASQKLPELFPEINKYDEKLILAIYEN
jgi:hypothetical protein